MIMSEKQILKLKGGMRRHDSCRTTRSRRGSEHFRALRWLRLARQEGCLGYIPPFLACPAERPPMGRMTWHLATPRRLEPDLSRSGRSVTTAPAHHGGLVVRRRAGVMDRCSTDTALHVPLRALFAVAHMITPTLEEGRIPRGAEFLPVLHHGHVECNM